MLRYTLRRFGFLLLTLVLTSIIIFVIAQVLPGDVARVLLGREAPESAVQALRVKLGLNDPLPVQYGRWLFKFVQGDWGESFSQQGRAIRPLVLERLTRSIWLAGITLVISVPLAILLGVLAGLNAGRPIDGVISVSSLALVGLPEFVTGIVLTNVLAYQLGWFPASSLVSPKASFQDTLPSLWLPAITATLVLLAYVIRLTRAGVIEVLKKAYVRTAVLKGLPWRQVITSHVLRNALLPTITVVAISFGWLISGLVVIENVYAYPGLGSLMSFAVARRDLPLMEAIAMMAVVFYTLANLAADLLYAWLNPRIRLE
ncbi:MAG TPA: ABC transporter permease [Aggregatilineales bacterium]|nr:ABC transporter permease [Aggregatilineales bacterium]